MNVVISFLSLFLPVVFFSFFDLLKLDRKLKNILYVAISIYVIVFSMFWVTSSGDYFNYSYFFEIGPSINDLFSHNENISRRFTDPGYVILNAIIKTFVEQPQIAVSMITIIGLIGILYQTPKYTTGIFLALSVYIAHFYWWYGIVLLRQILAMGFIFPVIHLLTEKRYFKSILLILTAAAFHSTVLIFLIVFPLLFRNYSSKTIIVASLICFICGYLNFFGYFVQSIIMIIPRGEILLHYFLNPYQSSNIFYFLEMALILFVAVFYKNKLYENNKYTRLAINYLTIAVCIAGFFQHFEFASRLSTYFVFFAYLILLPSFPRLFLLLKNRFVYYLILQFYLLIFLIRFINVNILLN